MEGGNVISMNKPMTLFYSYASNAEDAGLRERLERHLAILKRAGRITDWHQGDVLAGQEVAETIDEHFKHAQIILLLISSDFIDYCFGEEVKQALERHERHEAYVIPILLRSVYYELAPFAKLAVLPKNGQAITQWRDLDAAFTEITKELNRILDDLVADPLVEPKPEDDLIVLVPSQATSTSKKESERQADENETLILVASSTIFTLKLEPLQKVSFSIKRSGQAEVASGGARDFSLSFDLDQKIEDLGTLLARYHQQSTGNTANALANWRRNVKKEGQQLYEDFVQEDLKAALDQVRRETPDPAKLTLVFEGARTDLSTPFELLCDEDGPLALKYPLCRLVSEVEASRPAQHFDAYLSRLHRRRSPLKILLIGTGEQDTAADQEIAYLYGRIMQQTQERGFRPRIDIIRPYETTYEKVRQQLSNPYHIVHFVGKGAFDENAQNEAGLLLKLSEQDEEQKMLTMTEIINMLNRNNDPHLFYLGNSVGVWSSSAAEAHDSSSLGAMEALVRAGVHYVLGFRWHIKEERARLFAASFYEHLFQPPFVPERALWHARQRLGESDETWTSPVLVSQYPYDG